MAGHIPRGLSQDELTAWMTENFEKHRGGPVDPAELSAAKRADHPHLVRTGYALHLFDGAWVRVDRPGRVDRAGDAVTGRVRGLRDKALRLDVDGTIWLATRRDGVAWPTDVDTLSLPEKAIEVVARPSDTQESGDPEIWTIRTAWLEENL